MNAQEAHKEVFDYHIQGVVIKNVPFIVNKYNKYEPYLLDGNTLERVYELLDKNFSNKPILYYVDKEMEEWKRNHINISV